jgi:hypothetical protein
VVPRIQCIFCHVLQYGYPTIKSIPVRHPGQTRQSMAATVASLLTSGSGDLGTSATVPSSSPPNSTAQTFLHGWAATSGDSHGSLDERVRTDAGDHGGLDVRARTRVGARLLRPPRHELASKDLGMQPWIGVKGTVLPHIIEEIHFCTVSLIICKIHCVNSSAF